VVTASEVAAGTDPETFCDAAAAIVGLAVSAFAAAAAVEYGDDTAENVPRLLATMKEVHVHWMEVIC